MNQYTMSIDFAAESDEDAQRIAIAIGEAATTAGENAGGEDVSAEPLTEL